MFSSLFFFTFDLVSKNFFFLYFYHPQLVWLVCIYSMCGFLCSFFITFFTKNGDLCCLCIFLSRSHFTPYTQLFFSLLFLIFSLLCCWRCVVCFDNHFLACFCLFFSSQLNSLVRRSGEILFCCGFVVWSFVSVLFFLAFFADDDGDVDRGKWN